MTSRSYVMTVMAKEGHPVEDLYEQFARIGEENLWDHDDAPHSSIRYLIFQGERGEGTGREHLQCYIELARPQRRTYLKNLFHINWIHMETRRGTRDEARDYCRKTDTRILDPVELGQWRKQGQGCRNDLHRLHEDLLGGSSMLAVSDDHFACFIKYSRSIQLYYQLHAPKRREKTALYLYIGPPGCGKSKMIMDLHEDAYWKPPNNNWWPNYNYEKNVVFDDFSGKWMPASELLRLADRYPLMTSVKGAHVQFNSSVIHITSNYGPKRWYNWNQCQASFEAFVRRIDRVFVYDTHDLDYCRTGTYFGVTAGTLGCEMRELSRDLWTHVMDYTRD